MPRPSAPKSVIPSLFLSHGTMMSKNLRASRRFYEEFLGLEVVRHMKPAMMVRLRSGVYVVCVAMGDRAVKQHLLTHWGINVASREEVDKARADAMRLQDEYGIQKIHKIHEREGAYAFYLQDLDHNWWEIQHDPQTVDAFFDRGDVIDMSVAAPTTSDSQDDS